MTGHHERSGDNPYAVPVQRNDEIILEIGCVDRLSLVLPLGRVLSEIEALGAVPVRVEFLERPDCRNRRTVGLGVTAKLTERAIVDELTDDVVIVAGKAHVVVSAPDDVNRKIWILDAESAAPWGETLLDAIVAMEGVAFAIHASGDTIVSGEIDISASMELPVTDYRYISGRIRPDRITSAREP
jgi:hypothetical protein